MDFSRSPQLELDQFSQACDKQQAAARFPAEQRGAGHYDSADAFFEGQRNLKPWSQSYETPHSCRHCGQIKVVTDPKDDPATLDAIEACIGKVPFIRFCIANRIANLRKAMDDKCLLFEFWFDEYRDMKDSELLDLFDVDGSGTEQGLFHALEGALGASYGYWDLTLRLKEGKYKTQGNGLRAIIQPGRLPPRNAWSSFQPFLQASSKYLANNSQMS